jgi:hypothetical protein
MCVCVCVWEEVQRARNGIQNAVSCCLGQGGVLHFRALRRVHSGTAGGHRSVNPPWQRDANPVSRLRIRFLYVVPTQSVTTTPSMESEHGLSQVKSRVRVRPSFFSNAEKLRQSDCVPKEKSSRV